MASDFLKKMAEGTGVATSPSSAVKTQPSSFLEAKARERAAIVDKKFGSNAYGGTARTFDLDTGFKSWAESFDKFQSRVSDEYSARSRGSGDEAGEARDKASISSEANYLKSQIGRYRNYFESNADRYGQEQVSAVLSYLDEATKYLSEAPAYVDSGRNTHSFSNWMYGLNTFSRQMADSYRAREGQYQTAEEMKVAQKRTRERIAEMQEQSKLYRDYFTANKSLFGEDTYSQIMTSLDEADKFLAGAGGDLNSEYSYWSQWATEEDYNDFLRVSQLDVGASKEKVAQMEETLQGLDDKVTYYYGLEDFYTTQGEDEKAEDARRKREAIQAHLKTLEPTRKRIDALNKDIAAAEQMQESNRLHSLDVNTLRADVDSWGTELQTVEEQIDTLHKQVSMYSNSNMPAEAQAAQKKLEAAYAKRNELKDKLASTGSDLVQLEKMQENGAYKQLMFEADFAEFSAEGAAMAKNRAANVRNHPEWFAGEEDEAEEGKRYVSYVHHAEDGTDAAEHNREALDKEANKARANSGDDLFLYMTEDEFGIYNYLLAKEGTKSANNYFKSIKERLSYRKAEGISAEVNGKLERLGLSFNAGLTQFGHGIAQLFTKEQLPMSATQIAAQMEQGSMSGFEKIVNQATTTVANMLPSILVSAVTAGFGAPAAFAGAVGSATMGLSAGGNYYSEALNYYSPEKARQISFVVGASEGALQYLLGGIGGLGGITDDVLLAKTTGIGNAVGRLFARGAIKLGSEITEEELQAFLEPLFRKMILREEYKAPTWQELVETALVTAISTGLLEGGSVIKAEVDYARYGEMLLETQKEASRLGEVLANTPESSTAHKLALELESEFVANKKLDPAELGRLWVLYGQEIRTVEDTEKDEATAETVLKNARVKDAETATLENMAKSEDADTAEYGISKLAHKDASMVSPVAKRLMDMGVKGTTAVEQADLINRIAHGPNLSKNEVENIRSKILFSNESVRTVFAEATGYEVKPSEVKTNAQKRQIIRSAAEVAKAKADTAEAEKARKAAVAAERAKQNAVQQAEQQQAQAQAVSEIQQGAVEQHVLNMAEQAVARKEAIAAGDAIEFADGSTLSLGEFEKAYRKNIPNAPAQAIVEAFRERQILNSMGKKIPGSASSFTVDPDAARRYNRAKAESEKRDSIDDKDSRPVVKTDAVGRTEAGRAKEREMTLARLNTWASKYGLTVKVQSPDGKLLKTGRNGYYDAATKSVVLNAERATNQYLMTYYFVHELTHHAQKLDKNIKKGLTTDLIAAMRDPEIKKLLAKAEFFGESDVDKIIAKTRDLYERAFRADVDKLINEARIEHGERFNANRKKIMAKLRVEHAEVFAEMEANLRAMKKPNYIEDEVACDFMMKAIGDRTLLDTLAGVEPSAHRGLISNVREFLKGMKKTDPGVKEARRLIERLRGSLGEAEENKNTAAESGEKRYAIDDVQRDLTVKYQQAVDSVISGTYKGDDAVIMGYTPSVYQDLGMPSLPFVFGPGHILSVALTDTQAKKHPRYDPNANYHGLGSQVVENLYDSVKSPVMVIAAKDVDKNKSPMRSTHSVVAIVNVGSVSKPLLLPIELTAERTVDGAVMDVNVLSSAYPKNVTNLIKEAVALESAGDVGVYYTTKAAASLPVIGFQLPGHLASATADSHIIHRFSEKINMSIQKPTQSVQFKRWFGDWQNRPDKASVVVDQNGEPLIVYHGTDADIDEFKPEFTGKGNDQYGSGYYFTTRAENAQRYASGEKANIIPAYLNIRRPLVLEGRDTPNLYQVDVTAKQATQILLKHPDILSEDDSILGDFYEEYWETGPSEELVRRLAHEYSWTLGSLETDVFRDRPEAFHTAVRSVLSYDGVQINFPDGSKHYVAWFPNQIKHATENVGTYSRKDNRIRYSITPEQDAEYMTAVQNGDMKTAQRMVDEAAKAAGFSVKAHHATNAEFTVFDIDKTADYNFHGKGIYFTSSTRDLEYNYENYEGPDPWQKIEDRAYELASDKYDLSYEDTLTSDSGVLEKLNECFDEAIREFNKTVRRINAYLRFDNPFVLEKEARLVDNIDRTKYDGIIDKKVYETIGHAGMDEDTIHYIVFNPRNIKSADPVTYDDDGNVIPLSQRFNDQNEDIRYSLDWGEQIDHLIAGDIDQTLKPLGNLKSVLYVMPEPTAILQQIDLSDLALVTTQKHARQMLEPRKIVNGKVLNPHAHQLSEAQVRRLPEYIQQPLALFKSDPKSKSRGGVVILTAETDPFGDPVIVTIAPDQPRFNYDGTIGPAHFVNMYGFSNANNWLETLFKNSAVIYLNKEKINTELDPHLAQIIAGHCAKYGVDYNRIIRTKDPTVNPGQRRFSISEETGYEEGSTEDYVMKLIKAGSVDDAITHLKQWAEDYQSGKLTLSAEDEALASKLLSYKFVTEEEAAENRKKLDELIERYGKLKTSANARSPMNLPKKLDALIGVSKYAQTIAEDPGTPEWMREEIQKAILNGDAGFTHEIISDKRAMGYLEKMREEKGDNIVELMRVWDGVLENSSDKLFIKKGDIALGEYLYTQAIKRGDVPAAMKLVAELSAIGTQAGRTLQAMQMLSKMTPAGQLYYLQKAVDRMNSKNVKKRSKMSKDEVKKLNALKAQQYQAELAAEEAEKNYEEAISILEKTKAALGEAQDANSATKQAEAETRRAEAQIKKILDALDKVDSEVMMSEFEGVQGQLEEVKALEAEVRRAERQMEAAKKRLADKDIEAIKKKSFATKAELEKVKALEAEAKKAEADLRRAEKQLDAAKERLSKHDIDGAKTKLAETREQIDHFKSLEADAKKVEAMLERAEARLNELTEDWEASAEDRAKVVADLAAVRDAIREAYEKRADFRKLKEKLKRANKTLERLNTEWVTMKPERERTEAQIEAMERRVAELKAEQATRQGELNAIRKAVAEFNGDIEERNSKKRWWGRRTNLITINTGLAEALLNAKTEKEMEDAKKAIIQDIAEQTPVTLMEMWNTWRYVAMLLNPPTHLRNIGSNIAMAATALVKDITGASLEGGVMLAEKVANGIAKEKVEWDYRTKHLGEALLNITYALSLGKVKADKYIKFAAEDAKEMKEVLTGGGKHNPADLIRDARKIFQSKLGVLGKPLDWLSNANSKALEWEDWLFLNANYTRALSQYLAAHKADVATLTSTPEGIDLLGKGRQWAVKEALEATFRDASAVASALNRLEHSNVVFGFIVGGVMPYKKTPINILKRGVEYSPAGVVNTIRQMTKDEDAAAYTIDALAKTITGTGLAALGFLLARWGLLRALGSDDEKEREFEELQGKQQYSLQLQNGGSYTVEWVSPAAMPMLSGALYYETITEGKNDLTLGEFSEVLLNLASPMFHMSLIDGLNRTLSAVKYAEEDREVPAILGAITTSYLGQAVPSFAKKIARIVDDTRRTVYIDKNSDVPVEAQRALQNFSKEFRGDNAAPYLDAWGRTDTESRLWVRLLENLVSPGYYEISETSAMEEELNRLYKATGESSVLPKSVPKYFNVDKVRHDLSQKEWVRYQTVAGQGAYELLTRLTNSRAYRSLTDELKVQAVKDVYTYANEKGKEAAVSEYSIAESWVAKADKLADSGVSVEEYIVQSRISKDSDEHNITDVLGMEWLEDKDKALLIADGYAKKLTKNTFTDPNRTGYEYTLTDEQVSQYISHYDELWLEEYAALISGTRFKRAKLDEQTEMIDALRAEVADDTRKRMARYLRQRGVRSTKKD